MGSIYRRTNAYCETCKRRPSKGCRDSGHQIKERESKIWFYQYTVGGKLIARSSKSVHRVDAERELRKHEDAVDKGAKPRGRLTFDEAVAKVVKNYPARGNRSLSNVEGRISKHLKPVFGGVQMTDITAARWEDYVAARKQAGAENGTINRERAIMSRAFTLSMRDGDLFAKPYLEKLPEADPRETFFSDEEFAKLRAKLPEHMRKPMDFQRETGWRKNETLQLTWEKANDQFVVSGSLINKSKKVKRFPINASIRAAIGASKRSGPIFTMPDGTAITVWHWNYQWTKARKAVGLPEHRTHDLSRTGVRRMSRSGLDRQMIKRLSGKTTDRVLDGYDTRVEDDLVEAGRHLDQSTAQSTAHKRSRKGRRRKRPVKSA